MSKGPLSDPALSTAPLSVSEARADLLMHAAGYIVQLPSHLLAVRGGAHVQLLCLAGLLGPACCPAL